MRQKTDVCLILEGTYPYVTGGVSSWVHQLVSSLKEFTFSLAVILPQKDENRNHKYQVPENVLNIEQIYLHNQNLPKTAKTKLPESAWEQVDTFHRCPFKQEKLDSFEALYKNFFDSDTRAMAPRELPNARQAWEILSKLYEDKAADQSFMDYFWTFRFVHLPLFQILSAELPLADIYHPVSTGYAGLLSVVAKIKHQRPVILTEHGIYTRERRIEISRSDWIYDTDTDQVNVRKSQSRFKDLWNKMFASMSQLCYAYSDVVITLFKKNQRYQIEDGADLGKMMIIPNGVDYESFRALPPHLKKPPDQLVLGFMGRVVAIKDVKTFIRTCKVVAESVGNLKVYLMGPTDEEPTYFEECEKLADFLGLSKIIEFTGKVDVKDYYPKIDILVLTSISEAQPLVILEANSMGIPVVSTNVGACEELLSGGTMEDRALGESGLLAGITNASDIAKAILKIWRSDDLKTKMSNAGKARVAQYYNRTELHNKYRQLYNHYKGS